MFSTFLNLLAKFTDNLYTMIISRFCFDVEKEKNVRYISELELVIGAKTE